ncbi:hypothetical protein Tco_1290775 [Tanacetum coccineum]
MNPHPSMEVWRRLTSLIIIDAIADLVLNKYTCIVSRTQCRNAKTYALNEGDVVIQDHYGFLRSYAKALGDSNKSSTVKVGVTINPDEKIYFDSWFLDLLVDDLDLLNGNGLKLMFDQHKGLIKVVKEVIPLRSISNVLATFMKDSEKKIERANPRADEYLVKKEPTTWLRAFFNEEDEYNEIGDRKLTANTCPYIQKMLELSKDQQRFWHVIPSGGNQFEVRKGCDAFKVYEPNRTCCCTQQSQVFRVSVVGTSNEAARTEGTRTEEATRTNGTTTKEVATRSKKAAKTFDKVQQRLGRLTKVAITGSQTISDEPQQRQQTRTTQPQQRQLRPRAALQFTSPRLKSQRILQKRLSPPHDIDQVWTIKLPWNSFNEKL